MLVEHLRQTGVGALPLDPPPPPPLPEARSEEQLLSEATHAVKALHDRHERMQNGAAVVAGLLAIGQGISTGSESQGQGQSQGGMSGSLSQRRIG